MAGRYPAFRVVAGPGRAGAGPLGRRPPVGGTFGPYRRPTRTSVEMDADLKEEAMTTA